MGMIAMNVAISSQLAPITLLPVAWGNHLTHCAPAVLYQKRVQEIGEQIGRTMHRIEKGMAHRQFRLKAAFVTFNSEQERMACQDNCPDSKSGLNRL